MLSASLNKTLFIYICVCVSVCEKERERKRGYICICVYMYKLMLTCNNKIKKVFLMIKFITLNLIIF